ncbi:MAG: hypothetical protein IJC83_01715 [Oscillospiraceae bacterium]|nr:hypothetical protein [Oscillospiraceae bacterium]
MNLRLGKIITVFISIMFIGYIGFQFFRYLYEPYKTEVALLYTQQDTINLKGIVIRDETTVKTKVSGVKSYLFEDGKKVAINTSVAEIYSDINDALNQIKIKELENEIDVLEASQDKGATYYVHTDVLNRQITQKVGNLVDLVYSGNVSDKQTIRDEMLTYLNRRQIVTGQAENFNDRISEIKSEIKQLQSQTGSPIGTAFAQKEGYFVSETDGYENLLTKDYVMSLDKDEFKNLINNPQEHIQGENIVGKIIGDFDWYFAVIVPKEQSLRFIEGASCQIDFELSKTISVPAEVLSVKQTEDGENYIALLHSDYMSSEISKIRIQNANISFKTYSGLKVNKKAIRFEDDVMGVYVRIGDEVEFKKIDVIFESNSFVLCEDSTDDKYLRQFDDIILEGRALIEKSATANTTSN